MLTATNNLSDRFIAVCQELETLNETFTVKGEGLKDYEGIWLPEGEVKLWQIPRTSGILLRSLVLAKQPQTILELGTSAGYSTLWLASGVLHTTGKVYSVDAAVPKLELATRHLTQAEVIHKVELIKGFIDQVLVEWQIPVDFVFLDADKANYLKYFKLLEPNLKPGAMIVADNVTDFGHLMEDFLTYIFESNHYISEILNIDHGLLIATKI